MCPTSSHAYATKRSGKYDASRETAFEPLQRAQINTVICMLFRDIPVEANRYDLLNAFRVQEVDQVLAHLTRYIFRRIGWFGGIAVAEHVGNDEPVAPTLKERDKQTPVMGRRGKAVAEKKGRLTLMG